MNQRKELIFISAFGRTEIFMNKITPILIIVVMFAAVALGGCAKKNDSEVVLKSKNIENTDNSWDVIKDRGAIKVAVKDEQSPYVTRSPDGSYSGFLIDVMNEIAKQSNLTAEYIEADAAPVTTLLDEGKADVILNGYTIAEFSNKNIKWLESIMTGRHIIVCKIDSDINAKDDLLGKKIGVAEGSISDITAQSDFKIDNDTLVKFETESDALIALSTRKIDALIIDDSYFYNSKYVNRENYKILDEIISAHVHCFGVKKENEQLAQALSDITKQLSKDGTLDKISLKWFDKGISE